MIRKIFIKIMCIIVLFQQISYSTINSNYYTPEDQEKILEDLSLSIFDYNKNNQKDLIEINISEEQNVYIIGDIHGDYLSLDFVKKIINKEKNSVFVFLGDYIDRGPNSIEVFLEIAKLKKEYFDNIILLSGNHERYTERYQVYLNGLNLILKKYYNSSFDILYNKYKSTFELLYSAAILNFSNSKSVFCTHGGVPIDINNNQAFKLSNFNNLSDFDKKNVLEQLLWNEPTENNNSEPVHNNIRDPENKLCVNLYSNKTAQDFLDTNNYKAVFRGHTHVYGGYKRDFENINHFTVFSAPHAGNTPGSLDENYTQDASIIKISPDCQKIEIIIFGTNNSQKNSENLEYIEKSKMILNI